MVSLVYRSTPIIFFYAIFLFLQPSASQKDTDSLSLLKFKEAITNDPDTVLNSWNSSIHFCKWLGITCSKRRGRVTSIVLPNMKLFGRISPYIGNLSFVRLIHLQDNNFHGEIPHEVGRLFRMQVFNLSNNAVGGEIPISIANCSQIKYLFLGTNKIAGTIPQEIGYLAKLEMLNLEKTNLTGEIPSSIGNISTLESFSISYNSVEGSIPDTFGKLSKLLEFGITDNKISGLVPPSIFNITSLNFFFLASNQLHGTLPERIGLTLPKLNDFSISRNMFTGTIPKSISNCSQLGVFDISANRFAGQVPTDLGKLQGLSWINVGDNKLGSNSTNDLSFLKSLTNCTNLQVLAIYENHFGGTLPHYVSNMSTQLIYFYIGGNQISGMVPAGLDNLIGLIGLGMSENRFTGSIPSYLGKLSNLQVLRLGSNQFSGKFPMSLGNLSQLVELHLYNNKLNGSIPASIGNCQMLNILDLSYNNLTGEIPKQIFLLSSLSMYVRLARNMLVGNLPPEIGKLTTLNEFSVGKNYLTGKIPETIGDCENLESLFLNGNFFEGTIPSSMASLRGLRFLDLAENNLSGPIPEDFQKLPTLKYLNISWNHLEGDVPMGGIFKNASEVSLEGNTELCGGVPDLSLPKCSLKTISKHKSSNSNLPVVITCTIVAVILMSMFFYLFWKKTLEKKVLSSVSMGKHLIKVSYGDIYRATDGFSADNLIGSGGFSSVYKGSLIQIEEPVAVKVLNLRKKGAAKSFKMECKALRNARHKNLVRLLTYCSTIDYKGNEFIALVYEFMAKGSLERWLQPRSAVGGSLNFLQRLNIVIDVASALHYLHDLCEIPIIHCDLKPSNILLDEDMIAHLSDFGLARLLSNQNESSQTSTTGNKGTIGYAAPEYGVGAMASKEGDIYSYGILVLEMFTGKRPTDEMFKDGLNLHDFVKAELPERLAQIVDLSLLPRDVAEDEVAVSDDANEIAEGNMKNEGPRQMTADEQNCLIKVLQMGLACSVQSPKDRMSMSEVTRKIQLIKIEFVGSHLHSATKNNRAR